MKPKTKLEKKVMSLYDKLPSLTPEQREFAMNLHRNYYVTAYTKKHYCLECGHGWEEKVFDKITKKVCPSCSKKLVKLSHYKSSYNCLAIDFAIVTTIDNMQVVLSYEVKMFMKKNEKAEYSIRRINCQFFDEQGNQVSVGRTAAYYYGSYTWSYQDMEIRKSKHVATYFPTLFFPKFKVVKKLKMKGIKNSFHKINCNKLIEGFMGEESIPETLFKAKQYALCSHNLNEYSGESKTKKYWKQIKICMRNNYIVKNSSDWFDYLAMLEEFGRDIHNAKYICPIDFKKEHQRYVTKSRRKREKLKLEEQIKQVKKDNKSYLEQKKDLLNFLFKKGNLTIMPFQNVSQFLEEGNLLNHCIFANGYYKRENSLIFSVRIDDVPIETIEYCLETKRVIQSRGKNNVPSKKNEEILTFFNKNKKEIDARFSSCA